MNCPVFESLLSKEGSIHLFAYLGPDKGPRYGIFYQHYTDVFERSFHRTRSFANLLRVHVAKDLGHSVCCSRIYCNYNYDLRFEQ